MNTRRAFWKWAIFGLVAATFLVWAQTRAVGGVAGMLQVGETSPLRPMIEEQLGEVPLAPHDGHDGQIFYAIGLDLDGDTVGPLLDHAAYRYRRILLPAGASLFGLLDGWALLWGQIVICVLSMAVATGLVAAMAARSHRSELFALTVLLNPGMWLSVQILTSDALMVALMIAGLAAYHRRGTKSSTMWFSLSGIAKDVALATPVPLGISRRDWKTAIVPVTALTVWMGWLSIRFGDGFAARGNLDWPFRGMLQASANWQYLELKEWVFLVFAMGCVAVGVILSIRRSWLRWPIAAWTALAIISSNWVWDFGNNAARAFAPIVVLAALAFCQVTGTASAESDSVAFTGAR